jgi:very-long-chain (3R)-3-hydroxyacyl-CoA dehydratase
MRRHYLTAYNLLSCLAWLCVFIWFWLNFQCEVKLWIWPLFIVQGMAIFDVFHSLLRIVPAPFFSTFIQFISRMFVTGVLFIAQYLWPLGNAWPVWLGTAVIFIVWPAAEVIRFGYYLRPSKGGWTHWLTWLRYSAFVVLYPTGVFAESLVMAFTAYFAYQAGGKQWMWWIIFVFICYALFFPKLYMYLWNQRKKILHHE